MYQSVWAPVRKDHRLSGFNKRHSFLNYLKSGNSKMKVSKDSAHGKDSLPGWQMKSNFAACLDVINLTHILKTTTTTTKKTVSFFPQFCQLSSAFKIHTFKQHSWVSWVLSKISNQGIYIHAFKIFMYLFIQFWLHWSSLLHVGFLWLQGMGATYCCGMQTSHCWGWLLLLLRTGSRHAGFSSLSTQAQQSLPGGSRVWAQLLCYMENLLRPGIKSLSPRKSYIHTF